MMSSMHAEARDTATVMASFSSSSCSMISCFVGKQYMTEKTRSAFWQLSKAMLEWGQRLCNPPPYVSVLVLGWRCVTDSASCLHTPKQPTCLAAVG